ncbi:hypothetical protein EPI10_006812 [Gossypium australe]|uniref:Uncharacterized protein n=1 Tax=Gossypium australe TaxID=47621 RepID=A0A5B6WTV6_9ROSI|nr:hypothetical protein EPI10_006812 [Gossypium australe]
MDHGLYFTKGQFGLVYYSDVDWASTIEDRSSTTGYYVYLGPNPIAWCSKKQENTNYCSLGNCVFEMLWIKQLLTEIDVLVTQLSIM